MKKVLNVIIIVIMLGIVPASCKKEQETVSNEKGQTEAGNPQNDAELDRILDFKKKVDERELNPDTRSAETVTLDKAMNNIVDLFNVIYTEPMAYYTATESHQFSISVPLTVDGKVLVDDVVAVYEQAVAEAREVYHTSSLANKGYRRLMVTFDMQRDGEVKLDFDGSYGEREAIQPGSQPHVSGPFSWGDNWYYKDGMGSCDETRPGGADKVLQDTIMVKVRADWPSAPVGYRGFYTDFVTYDFSGGPDYPGIFYSTDIDNTCIEWAYMNDYYAGEKRYIYQVIPQAHGINLNGNSMQQYRYYVTNVVIEGQGDEDTGPIYHWTDVEYARYYYIENGTIEQDEL